MLKLCCGASEALWWSGGGGEWEVEGAPKLALAVAGNFSAASLQPSVAGGQGIEGRGSQRLTLHEGRGVGYCSISMVYFNNALFQVRYSLFHIFFLIFRLF